MAGLSKKDFKKIFSKVPRLCVDMVIKDRRGVVMILRAIEPWKGFWQLPGGTVYFGETLQKAAVRIAKQETGLKIKVIKPLIVSEFLEEIKMAGRHTVSVALLCRPVSSTLRGSFQGERVEFLKKIPDKTIPQHKKIIQSA